MLTNLKEKTFNVTMLFPAPTATAIGGTVAHFMTSMPGLWGLAATVATALATGYGSRWGSCLIANVGRRLDDAFIFINAHKVVESDGDPDKLRKQIAQRFAQTWRVNATTVDVSDRNIAPVVFEPIGAVAGAIAGGVLAFHASHADIEAFVQKLAATQHARIDRGEPSRVVQQGAVNYRIAQTCPAQYRIAQPV
jgi:hypothetical protein